MAGSRILKIAGDDHFLEEVAALQEFHFRVEFFFRDFAGVGHHGVPARRDSRIHALALDQDFHFGFVILRKQNDSEKRAQHEDQERSKARASG